MKRLSLITEFDKYYKGSDLQKFVSHKPLPIKYTINDFDYYFYNADLFGLFEWKIQKDGLTTNDFIDDYKKGFEAGLLHLETSERIELKDLKSKDLREGTISQLQCILFEREFKTGSKGLLDLVFNKVPLIFTERVIYEFGYWNGIIYSIDKLFEKAGLRLDDLKALPPQPIVKQKPEQETPKIFDELFYNTDLITPCIDILKELDPPLIDTDCNYIGKLKGVFCVWIDEMQRQGIVKHYSDRKIFASLIPQKIKRFSIDESMFGKYQSKAENLYRTDIKTKVSQIKLSQNSQNGGLGK